MNLFNMLYNNLFNNYVMSTLFSPTFDDLVNSDGFDSFYSLFKTHLETKCCEPIDEEQIFYYLFTKWKNTGIDFMSANKDTIHLYCDACMTQDCCEYCSIRNLKHTNSCYHEVYDTVYEVLKHLIECEHVPANIINLIIENRRSCGLSDDNIHTITDGLSRIVFKECSLLLYNKKEHKQILNGEYGEICIFCSDNLDETKIS